jgi:Cof subfamily protein (haloacid dehalogenase superfamily)
MLAVKNKIQTRRMVMTKYQIAFFDIDGTLIDSRNHKLSMSEMVPESTKEAIKKIQQAGILPVIASGRHKEAVLDLASMLGIDSMITSNGQEITLQGKSIYQNWIEQAVVEEIYTTFEQRGIAVFYDTVHGIFSSPDRKNIVDRGAAIRFLESGEYPSKVLQIMVDSDDVEGISSWLTELKIVKSTPKTLDILPHGVSKATGIQQLLNILDLPMESSMAFGDEQNDLEMFDAVGTAVAMGNAINQLKEKADFVTREVWRDGIYYACQELNLFLED